jgi:NADPH2:quinone reductase
VLILGATGVAGGLAVQIAKRLGARRVVASGRNASGLEAAGANGADATISLEQDREALVEAFRKEIAENGVDVVLDYLWGAPAEAVFGAMLMKGAELAAKRTRYIQIGESAGKTIALPASVLRSSGVEILGSGFGSVALTDISKVIADFFSEAAKKPFVMKTEVVPLRDVEAAWTRKEDATRIVFRP